MKQFLILIQLLVFTQIEVLTAQTLRAYERAGDSAFEKKDYGAAVQYYGDVLRRHDSDLSLLWKYGESARLYNAFPEAERSYKKISESIKYQSKHPLVNYRLAEVKKNQGDYQTAIEYFERYISEKSLADTDYYDKAVAEIAHCQRAQTIAAAPTTVQVTHLGKEINSPWYDFAPSIFGDTLFYSSYRFDAKNGKGKSKRKLSKVMIASNGGRGREPGRGFPTTDTAHIAHTAFSPDGHYVFFTVCKDLDNNDKRCELWMTVIDRFNRWLPPVKLPEPVNMAGYTTTQPNVGYDATVQGPVLWFASDRPGGKGKLDLWRMPLDSNFFCPCNLPMTGKKIPTLPYFEQPVNISELNTPENEASPFFFAGDQKLYFSSEGLPGLGGFDIFYATKDSNHFEAPVNAGTGLNTSYNDLYLVLRKDGASGYLSSNRPGSLYLDDDNKSCCNDLFEVKMPRLEPVLPASHASSTPPKTDPMPPLSASTVETGATSNHSIEKATSVLPLDGFAGLSLYFDNDEPNKRTSSTTTHQTYAESMLAYLGLQSAYRKQFVAGLKGREAEAAAQLVDDFFEKNIKYGGERLIQLCETLLDNLQQGRVIELVVNGYTSPRAASDYNLNLSKRRLASVNNELEQFANGALRPFLISGKLIVSEMSLGETAATAGVSDDLQDERNSIYHPNAARERRVEIMQIVSR
jgi:tetratricopeptide (TPR) repeat protein